MNTNNGGPAFPVHGLENDPWGKPHLRASYGGMTLRDYFAAHALVAVTAGGDENGGLYPATYLDDKGEETVRAVPYQGHGEPTPKPNTLLRSAEENTAKMAYRLADAMLAAREPSSPPPPSEPVPEVAETFEMFGKTWTRHVPGDPMPCEPRRYVQCLFENGQKSGITANWTDDSKVAGYGIIGWRYAERSES